MVARQVHLELLDLIKASAQAEGLLGGIAMNSIVGDALVSCQVTLSATFYCYPGVDWTAAGCGTISKAAGLLQQDRALRQTLFLYLSCSLEIWPTGCC